MKVFFLLIISVSLYACSGNSHPQKGGVVNLYIAGCDSIFYCSEPIFNPDIIQNARKDDSSFLKKITDKALLLKQVILLKPLGGTCGGIGETTMTLNTIFTEKGLTFAITRTDSLEENYFNDISFLEVAEQMIKRNAESPLYVPKEYLTGMTDVKVKPEAAFTFLLSDNNKIYYYLGKFNNHVVETDYSKVGELIQDFMKKVNKTDLMFIIKAAPGSSFKNTIDILDELTINKVPPGHYAEIAISKEEIERINTLKKTKNG